MHSIQHISASILLATTVSLLSCSGSHKQPETGNSSPVVVTLATPSGMMTGGVSASGRIEARQTANISTRLMGTITRIHVKTGDVVRKGQVLATISVQDIAAKKAQASAAVTEAEANVKTAQKDFERFTNLYNKKSASAKELDNVTLQYDAARARLEAAQQMRNEVNAIMTYASLTAPFDGVVTGRMADEGALANPGVPLLVVEQSRDLLVKATVSERDIARIKTGYPAQVEVHSIGKTLNCRVTDINPSSAQTGGQYEIKLAIPGNEKKDLYPGMYANVFIRTGQEQGTGETTGTILVPLSSLVYQDQLVGIYTVSNSNTALLRWVRTGKKMDDKMEVLSGLGASEKFIVRANGKLYNGAPVIEKK
jgi:RND family efflux transporter MFP subunit